MAKTISRAVAKAQWIKACMTLRHLAKGRPPGIARTVVQSLKKTEPKKALKLLKDSGRLAISERVVMLQCCELTDRPVTRKWRSHSVGP